MLNYASRKKYKGPSSSVKNLIVFETSGVFVLLRTCTARFGEYPKYIFIMSLNTNPCKNVLDTDILDIFRGRLVFRNYFHLENIFLTSQLVFR